MLLIQFADGPNRPPIWVNPANVTWLKQVGTAQDRTEIHFAGGDSVEVKAQLQQVVVVLNGQLSN